MKVKEAERIRCLQCGWQGPASQLKPLKPLRKLKVGEDVLCVCPRCGHTGFEKLTEGSDLSELSEG